MLSIFCFVFSIFTKDLSLPTFITRAQSFLTVSKVGYMFFFSFNGDSFFNHLCSFVSHTQLPTRSSFLFWLKKQQFVQWSIALTSWLYFGISAKVWCSSSDELVSHTRWFRKVCMQNFNELFNFRALENELPMGVDFVLYLYVCHSAVIIFLCILFCVKRFEYMPTYQN